MYYKYKATNTNIFKSGNGNKGGNVRISVFYEFQCSSYQYTVLIQCRVMLHTTLCQRKLTTSTKKGISFLKSKLDTYFLYWIQSLYFGLKQGTLQQFSFVFCQVC